MRPDRGLAGPNGPEVLVYAGSYGLTPADGPAQLAGSAGSQAAGVTWPVRSGLVPPLADGFITRPETVPGLEAALVPGDAVALVPGQAGAGRPDGPGSSRPRTAVMSRPGPAGTWRGRDGCGPSIGAALAAEDGCPVIGQLHRRADGR
jgi:hypothetical protein